VPEPTLLEQVKPYAMAAGVAAVILIGVMYYRSRNKKATAKEELAAAKQAIMNGEKGVTFEDLERARDRVDNQYHRENLPKDFRYENAGTVQTEPMRDPGPTLQEAHDAERSQRLPPDYQSNQRAPLTAPPLGTTYDADDGSQISFSGGVR
jgi:hypothetical protein